LIILDDLIIYNEGSNINFKPKVANYELNIKKACNSIIVKAEPDNDDDYEQRVYTINVDRGVNTNVNNNSTNNGNSINTTNHSDQWVKDSN
jgi:hypothetical protein